MLNGEAHEAPRGANVAALVESLQIKGRRVAVMINDAVIRRERWGEVELNEGDRVEVIHMVGGG